MTIFTPNERLDYSAETRDSSGYGSDSPGVSRVGSGSRLGGNPGNTPVDKLTAGVFARARAQGVGYDAPVAGEYETAAGGLGYDDPDFDTQLMNPASARLQNTFDEAKAKVTRGMRVSPPGRTPQRARLAPTPRVATLVAVFLLAIGGLVVGWQVLSAPPSQPVPGTVETGVGQGSALQAAGTGSRGASGNSGANGEGGAGGAGGGDGGGGGDGASGAYAKDPKVAGQSPRLLLPGANGAELVVYVSGQVERPGVVRLADPARVTDALEAAGGAKPGADLRALNLARLVADGEQINVPLPGEAPPPGADAGSSGGSGSAGGSGGSGGSGGKGDKVNLNTADATDLQTLSGIGPALAQRILDYRKKNGQFHSIEQLDEVSGIGPAMMERLRDHVIL
ncbi:ComEA family DNA-binding protein [Mobiluncus mulieris]|uniref:ComEA family DNA-binding protein n=1 Tax=Mobiluncus mulieris TaxID=2052 RepID=UPI001470433E|nr:ComEA family DNA-binding protein [Mobiluncus mulieris]NMW60587.1 ComEA family DNA-binding protein [Mobiluncus mulieris]